MCCHEDSGTNKAFFLVQSGAALAARPSSDSAQDTKCLIGHRLLRLENDEQVVCGELTAIYSLHKFPRTQMGKVSQRMTGTSTDFSRFVLNLDCVPFNMFHCIEGGHIRH